MAPFVAHGLGAETGQLLVKEVYGSSGSEFSGEEYIQMEFDSLGACPPSFLGDAGFIEMHRGRTAYLLLYPQWNRVWSSIEGWEVASWEVGSSTFRKGVCGWEEDAYSGEPRLHFTPSTYSEPLATPRVAALLEALPHNEERFRLLIHFMLFVWGGHRRGSLWLRSSALDQVSVKLCHPPGTSFKAEEGMKGAEEEGKEEEEKRKKEEEERKPEEETRKKEDEQEEKEGKEIQKGEKGKERKEGKQEIQPKTEKEKRKKMEKERKAEQERPNAVEAPLSSWDIPWPDEVEEQAPMPLHVLEGGHPPATHDLPFKIVVTPPPIAGPLVVQCGVERGTKKRSRENKRIESKHLTSPASASDKDKKQTRTAFSKKHPPEILPSDVSISSLACLNRIRKRRSKGTTRSKPPAVSIPSSNKE